MSRRRQRSPVKGVAVSSSSSSASASRPLSEAEESELHEFCQGFSVEEVDFASFCHVNDSLHIYLRLALSLEECRQGGQRFVTYHLRVKNSCAPGVEVHKVESRCLVRWPPRSQWGDKMIFRNLGDQDISGKKGDVIVVLHPLQADHGGTW